MRPKPKFFCDIFCELGRDCFYQFQCISFIFDDFRTLPVCSVFVPPSIQYAAEGIMSLRCPSVCVCVYARAAGDSTDRLPADFNVTEVTAA